MISDALESLQVVSGHHSFFLVVNPNDEADKGFLGGTTLGREFWRGHRGCGAAGAQAFKLFCQKATNPEFSTLNVTQVLQQPQSDAVPSVGVFPYPANVSTTMIANPHSNVPKKNQASVIKAEVYASIRNAIRYVSLLFHSHYIIIATRFSLSLFLHDLRHRSVTGRRNAEMKWSNHDRLIDAYGVRLEGWPPSVPKQNPSTLSVAQNKAILEALRRGSMRFIPVNSASQVPGNRNVEDLDAKARDEQDIFEDAVDFSAGFGEDGVFEDDHGRTGSGARFVADHPGGVNERLLESTIQRGQDPMSSDPTVPGDAAGRGDGSNDTSFESTSHPMSADAQVHDDEDGIGTRKKRRMDGTGDNDV